MPLRATRSIGTGDGWDVTDSGLYVLDWAELDDVRPGHVIENPNRQPIGIDLFAGAGGFSCGFKQAGVIAANEHDVDAAHTYLCNLGSPRTRIVFCTPEDEDRWHPRSQAPCAVPHPAQPPVACEPGSDGSPDRRVCSRARCSSSATSARSPAGGSSTSLPSKAMTLAACSRPALPRLLPSRPAPTGRPAQRAGVRVHARRLGLC